MIKILLVQATNLSCSLTTTILREEPDIEVVGWTTDIEEALQKASASNFVLIDASLPQGQALSLTKQLSEQHPQINVLIFGLPEKPNVVLRYMEAGADGYVPQELQIDDLINNVRAVHDGEALISPKMTAELLKRLNDLATACLDDSFYKELEILTPREREALDLVGQGLTNSEISEKLNIQVGTVKNHIHNILKKLNVNNRYEAANIYQKQVEVRELNIGQVE